VKRNKRNFEILYFTKTLTGVPPAMSTYNITTSRGAMYNLRQRWNKEEYLLYEEKKEKEKAKEGAATAVGYV
jgi:hypothetical protein